MEPYLQYVKLKKVRAKEQQAKDELKQRIRKMQSKEFSLPELPSSSAAENSSHMLLGLASLENRTTVLPPVHESKPQRFRSPLNRAPRTDEEREMLKYSDMFEEALALFNIFDTDGDGWIDVNAFGLLLEETMHVTEMNKHHSARDVRDVIIGEVFARRPAAPSINDQFQEHKDDGDDDYAENANMKVNMETFFTHFKLLHRWADWERARLVESGTTNFQFDEQVYPEDKSSFLTQLYSFATGNEPPSLRTNEYAPRIRLTHLEPSVQRRTSGALESTVLPMLSGKEPRIAATPKHLRREITLPTIAEKVAREQGPSKRGLKRALLKSTARMRKLKTLFGRKARERAALRAGVASHDAMQGFVTTLAQVRRRNKQREANRRVASDGSQRDLGSPQSGFKEAPAGRYTLQVVHHHNALKVHLPVSRTTVRALQHIKRVFGTFIYRDFHALDLSDNCLDDRTVTSVFEALTKHVFELDLSKNQISLVGCRRISLYLSSDVCNLHEINLASNKINDVSVLALCEGVEINPYLHKLDLSHNQITSTGSAALAAAFQARHLRFFDSMYKTQVTARPMLELNLSWNRVGSGLAPLLCIPYLEALSIASNALGHSMNGQRQQRQSPHRFPSLGHPDGEHVDDDEPLSPLLKTFADILSLRHLDGGPPVADLLRHLEQETVRAGGSPGDTIYSGLVGGHSTETGVRECMDLVFLDISNNHLSEECVEYIGDQLRSNHILLSLHIFGNNHGRCWVDSRGFVKILEQDELDSMSGIRSRRIHATRRRHHMHVGSNKALWVSQPPIRERSRQSDIPKGTLCWLSQRWNEHRFTCVLPTELLEQLLLKNTGKTMKELRRSSASRGRNQAYSVVVLLHLECDDWQGDVMNKVVDVTSGETNTYELWRVVPPSTQHFYFSVHFAKKSWAKFRVLPARQAEELGIEFPNDRASFQSSLQSITKMIFTMDTYPTDKWGDVMLFHGNNVTPPADTIDAVTLFNHVDVPPYHGPTQYEHVVVRQGPAHLSSHLPRIREDAGFVDDEFEDVVVSHRSVWSLPYSVFSGRRKECDSRAFFDEPRTMELAFATDFQLLKLPSDFLEDPAEVDELKDHFHVNYPWYCSLFRQVCTMFTYTPSYRQLRPPSTSRLLQEAADEFMEGPVPSLEIDAFIDFLTFCGMLDDENLTDTEARQVFIACNVEVDAADNLDLQLINQMNPDVDMCRYEFIEALLRIALLKFPEDSPMSAVTKFLRDVREGCKYGSRWVHLPNEARALFYTEKVDKTIRAFLPGLRRLFAKHVSLGGPGPASPRAGGTPMIGYMMNFRQFFALLDEETYLMPDMLSSLAARQIFNEAKMEPVIAVASGKSDRLSFCDFLDALCRIAHYLIPFQSVEKVLFLLLDKSFFKVPWPTDRDDRYYTAKARESANAVAQRLVVSDHTFYERKVQPLQSIYQAHVSFLRERARAAKKQRQQAKPDDLHNDDDHHRLVKFVKENRAKAV